MPLFSLDSHGSIGLETVFVTKSDALQRQSSKTGVSLQAQKSKPNLLT